MSTIDEGVTSQARFPTTDSELLRAAHAFLHHSIDRQASALTLETATPCFDAAYANASLIAVQTINRRATLFISDPASLQSIAAWFRCWRGIKSLVQSSPGAFSGSRAAFSFPAKGISDGAHELLGRHDKLGFLLAGLPRMSTPYTTLAAYQDVKAFLEILFSHTSHPPYGQLLLAAPEPFVQAVERCEPTALVLLGAFFALIRAVEEAIIFSESVEADLGRILAYLPRMHKRLLLQAMETIEERRKSSQTEQEIALTVATDNDK